MGVSKVYKIGSKEKTEVYRIASTCRKCAEVIYYSEEEVQKAIELNQDRARWIAWACGHLIVSPKYLRSYNERI